MAFANTLLQSALTDDRIILLSGDLGFGVFDEFSRLLPDQFINCGITEQSIISIASGMASMGFKPYVYSIANFPTLRALEQIRNDICYNNLDVTIVAIGAGYAYGGAGYTHHALEDLSALRILPNIKILTPLDSFDAARLTVKTINSTGPKYLRLGKSNNNDKFDADYVDGKFTIIKEGTDGVILFTGSTSQIALKLKMLLHEIKLNFAVVGCSEINNLDSDFLRNNSNLFFITLEDHYYKGGFGSSILEWFSEESLSSYFVKVFGFYRENLNIVGDNSFLNKINGMNETTILNKLLQDNAFISYIKLK